MGNFTPEQRHIAETFQRSMANFQKEPLVLYGFGRNTEAILKLTSGYNFVGILGPDKSTGYIYEMPILSLDVAATLSKIIVIIAPKASRQIIFRRIQDFVRGREMSVYDYEGIKIVKGTGTYKQMDLPYWDCSWEDLCSEIQKHDVISFDIFDTLVARYVLKPYDILSIMERKINDSDGSNIQFKNLRKEAEHNCIYGATIYDIYQELEKMGFSDFKCKEWCSLELALEEKMVFPRKKMVEAYNYAISLGKKVCLTSDMYLPGEEVRKLLSICNIYNYSELLVSCDCKAEKRDGSLFALLLAKNPGKSILHIGDNAFSDIKMAKSSGIDAWQVLSGYDLFMVSSISDLLSEASTELGDRLALGMICAKLFENPFVLTETKGQVVLSGAEEVGFCFIGPWTLGFMHWFIRQLNCFGIEQVVFPSRDGFLFYNIAHILKRHDGFPLVDSLYMRVSRQALATACIYTEKDIADVLRRERFRGTYGEMLKSLFRIETKDCDKQKKEIVGNAGDTFFYLKKHEYISQILQEARMERKNYLKYLRHMGFCNGKKIAIFDFVAEGSVQHYLEQLTGKKMVGLYCGTKNHPNEWFPEKGHVVAAFGNSDAYDSKKLIFRIYMAMEAILVDGNPSLAYINADGVPQFQRTDTSYTQALAIQKSACKFVDEFYKRFGDTVITLSSAEGFLQMLFRSNCQLGNEIVQAFCHDDTPIPGESSYYTID